MSRKKHFFAGHCIFFLTVFKSFSLPNGNSLVLGNEQLVLVRNIKRLVPLVYVRKCAVNSPATERMGVALCATANFFVADVCSPNIGVCYEETLVGCETVNAVERIFLHCILQSLECHFQTTVVCKIFAQCQRTVHDQSQRLWHRS